MRALRPRKSLLLQVESINSFTGKADAASAAAGKRETRTCTVDTLRQATDGHQAAGEAPGRTTTPPRRTNTATGRTEATDNVSTVKGMEQATATATNQERRWTNHGNYGNISH